MESIEVVPTANLIKFFGELEINKLIKANGMISGFGDTPVAFTALGSDLKLEVPATLYYFLIGLKVKTILKFVGP